MYAQPGQPFLITICTSRRRRLFADEPSAELAFKALLGGKLATDADLVAACLMPDHLHVLLIPRQRDLVRLLSQWKSHSTHLLREAGLRGPIWQRSFYDHALRREEDLIQAAEYVVSNPVRKGLVKEWRTYPLSYINPAYGTKGCRS